jgi:dihydroorotate dehydrogenase (NAD+) catalytic subunit
MGADPGETAAAVEHLRALTDKPLIVKLTPTAPDQAAVARAAEQAGADAVSLINTVPGMAFDPLSGRPWLGAGSGGQSGPAVRAIALNQVRQVAGAIALPIVGMGGIASADDAFDFLRAGASCVAVGTESFRDAAAGVRIRTGLAGLVTERVPDAAPAPAHSGDEKAVV